MKKERRDSGGGGGGGRGVGGGGGGWGGGGGAVSVSVSPPLCPLQLHVLTPLPESIWYLCPPPFPFQRGAGGIPWTN